MYLIINTLLLYNIYMPTQRLHGYSCNHVTICCQLSQYKTYVLEGLIIGLTGRNHKD